MINVHEQYAVCFYGNDATKPANTLWQNVKETSYKDGFVL